MQLLHGLGRILPENICDSDEPEKHAFLHKEKRRLPFFCESVRTGAQGAGICQRGDVGEGATGEHFPLQLPGEALSGEDEEIGDFLGFDPPLFRKIGDGACERML